ncbi:hypothetical protein [Devosia sp. DBB001]|nr:hypothetical protein [Devosia sp. DBB001]
MSDTDVIFWRRTDISGLERLALTRDVDGIAVSSSLVCLEAGGFRLDHHWQLDPNWRAQRVSVERWNGDGHKTLDLERAGSGWKVDGIVRLDLEGVEEPDLSVTPFCNTLPIRRLSPDPASTLTLDVAFIDGPTLTVARSRQRYGRVGPGEVHYTDLGLSQGFEADLSVDEEGLVLTYQHLFERVFQGD